MSGRVKRHVLCLQMLNRTKNTKLRKAILEYADADLISALCECAHNILRGTVRLTPREKVRLRKYKDKLRLIANRRWPYLEDVGRYSNMVVDSYQRC